MPHGVLSTDGPAIGKVAVLRALKLGDLLVAVPALRALRAALPAAEIILVGLPWAVEFAGRYRHLLDGFREYPGHPELPERVPDAERIPHFYEAMRAERFDLVIQLHGSGPVVNDVCARFGARHAAGFYLPGTDCPDPARFLPWPDRGLELRRLMALTTFLGASARGEHLEFPLTRADRAAAAVALGPAGAGDYVCIHPGASVPERRWPADRFAAVADTLSGRGLRVVLTGTAGESGLTRAVAASMRAPAVSLAGETDLGGTAAVLAGSRLLIANDTGVSHLAAAGGCPSVIVSTGDNPARWAPPDGHRHRVVCAPPGARVPVGDVARHAAALLTAFPGGVECVPSAS